MAPHVNARRRFIGGLLIAAVVPFLSAEDVPPKRLLLLGDSLSAGYGLPPEQGFATRLEAALSKNGPVTVINGAVSGTTSEDGLGQLAWHTSDGPDAVLLELGSNDMLRGIDPSVTEENLSLVLTRLKSQSLPVLLCGMKAAANWGGEYRERFDALFPTLAKRFGVPLYPFFLDGVALDPNLVQPDGMHPNAAGVEVIVTRIRPYVERLLGRNA